MVRDRHITVQRQTALVKDVTQVASLGKLAETEIIDARAAARFKGEGAEPRAGLRSGHIPDLQERALRRFAECKWHDEGPRSPESRV